MTRRDFDESLGNLADNSEMIREYWRDVRANWQASEASLRRTVFYIVALAASFVLLGAHGIDEVTFVGLKVTDLNTVRTTIPLVIGYLIYVASANAAISIWLMLLHDDLAACYWPKFFWNNLELAVRPVGSFADTSMISSNFESRRMGGLSQAGNAIRFVVLLGGPIVFEVFALWQVLAQQGGIYWLKLAVTLASMLLVLVSVPHLVSVGAGFARKELQ